MGPVYFISPEPTPISRLLTLSCMVLCWLILLRLLVGRRFDCGRLSIWLERLCLFCVVAIPSVV